MILDTQAGVLGVDIETASAHEIKFGAWSYSQHPSTVVYCVVFAYGINGKRPLPYLAWEPGTHLPADLVDFIEKGGTLIAHNAAFEKAIWENILIPFFDFPSVAPDQWKDTQALGLALNLPASLAGLAAALGCKVQKDTVGGDLMKKMAVAEEDGVGGWRYPLDNDANRTRLRDYCCLDVGATLDAFWRMSPLSVTEALVWQVDQRVNARGVYLDRAFADQCAAVTEQRRAELSDEAWAASAGELLNSTSAPALKTWLKACGVKLPKVKRKKADGTYHQTETADRNAVLKILEAPDLPADVRQVLENRMEANKVTSLAKLKRVHSMIGTDGRLRNALQYCGANTGRWTSYGLQVHNLPKDKMKPAAGALVRCLINRGSLDGLKMITNRPLEAVSQSLRSVIAAPPGRELIAGDYSAIEARVLAWLAGQEDILHRFRVFDEAKRCGRKIQDVYEFTAEAIGSDDRQLGKVCVLALGYGMGALKFWTTAGQWGVPLALKDAARIQKAWRKTNVQIVAFWKALEEAVRCAIERPNVTFPVGKVKAFCNASRLMLVLPSGRVLSYWRPKIVPTVKEIQVVDEDGAIVTREMHTQEIRFYTQGADKKSMVPESTYGGKLVENVTQAIARDLLAEALVRVDKVEPYDIVMHVHDSIAAEVPAGKGRVSVFAEIMAALPPWAEGLPIEVEGYRDTRFRG